MGGKFARVGFPKIGKRIGERIGKRARAAPCCARCTPRTAKKMCCLLVLNSVTSTPQWIRQPKAAWLSRRASHAASPRPCAQHHIACAGPRRCAAHRVPILKHLPGPFSGRHCECRGSAARPLPRPALRASAEAHRDACLPRAGCPLAPAARASASLLCCFVGGRVLLLLLLNPYHNFSSNFFPKS